MCSKKICFENDNIRDPGTMLGFIRARCNSGLWTFGLWAFGEYWSIDLGISFDRRFQNVLFYSQELRVVNLICSYEQS